MIITTRNYPSRNFKLRNIRRSLFSTKSRRGKRTRSPVNDRTVAARGKGRRQFETYSFGTDETRTIVLFIVHSVFI